FLNKEFGDTYASDSVVYEIPGVQTRAKQGYVVLDADLTDEQKHYELVRVYPSLHLQRDSSLADRFSNVGESIKRLNKYAQIPRKSRFEAKYVEVRNLQPGMILENGGTVL